MNMAPNARMEQDEQEIQLIDSDVSRDPVWSYKQQPIWSDAAAAESMRVGCCGRAVDGDLVPPWMEWVESGIEFFGCDESSRSGKSVIGRALMLSNQQAPQEMMPKTIIEKERDFAELHDQFIEALIFEQMKLLEEKGSSPFTMPALQKSDSMTSFSSELSSCASTLTADESIISLKNS